MARNEEPDPQLMWRWLGETVRPWLGWLVALVGVVALVLGYLGVSREVLVAKQLPFLVSGGLGGIALVFIGGVLLGTQDVRRQGRRLESLEEQVADLHDVLLAFEDEPDPDTSPHADATAVLAVATDDVASSNGAVPSTESATPGAAPG